MHRYQLNEKPKWPRSWFEALENRKVSCHCQQSNHVSPVVQSAAWLMYSVFRVDVCLVCQNMWRAQSDDKTFPE